MTFFTLVAPKLRVCSRTSADMISLAREMATKTSPWKRSVSAWGGCKPSLNTGGKANGIVQQLQAQNIWLIRFCISYTDGKMAWFRRKRRDFNG
jgi:hypothetical protein